MREQIIKDDDGNVTRTLLWPDTVEELLEATTREVEEGAGVVGVYPTNSMRDLCRRLLIVERGLHDAAEYRLEQSE